MENSANSCSLMAFDFDGTLFVTDLANFKSYEYALMFIGVALTFNQYVKDCSGKDYKEFLRDLFNITDEATLKKVHDDKVKVYPTFYHLIVPNTSLLEVAKKFHEKGGKTVIVSTASSESIKQILALKGYSGIFDAIIGKENVEHLKPNPEGFIKACKLFACSYKNINVYEDNQKMIDVLKEMGITGYLVNTTPLLQKVVRYWQQQQSAR